MKQWLRQAWCRVVYGHVLIPYGNERGQHGQREHVWYMCARCLMCQKLWFVGRTDAE